MVITSTLYSQAKYAGTNKKTTVLHKINKHTNKESPKTDTTAQSLAISHTKTECGQIYLNFAAVK